jgi:thymidylate synthase (FAD)
MVAGLIKSGHHSVLEHHNLTVRIITDRGVTHEIVRHRLASYSQESTRYCNYSQEKFGKEITVILPVWFYEIPEHYHEEQIAHVSTDNVRVDQFFSWRDAMLHAQSDYFRLLKLGQTAQEARSVLPNSLKTEIVMTANLREWRHFFTLRASAAAHPQMRELAREMLIGFRNAVPVMFDDILC